MLDAKNRKEELVEAAMRIVERSKGLRGASLRSIAREAGYSHANAYNYVSGLEELFWLAVDASMGSLATFCDRRMERRGAEESAIEALIAGQYEFAFDHEGLYRMIWFETPKGEAPESVQAKILAGSRIFSAKVAAAMGASAESPKTVQTAQMLHSFIHGQIAKLYSGRIPDPGRFIEGSKAQALLLFGILRDMPEMESYAGWITR